MYEYAAVVQKVHDGDTCTALADLGFCISQKISLRLYGLNTPELAKRPEGPAAQAFLAALVAGKTVLLRTHKDGKEKYGRYLAEIFLPGDPVSVNQKLIDAKHAKAWDGKGVRPT